MKLIKYLKRKFLKKKEITWREQYDVGRGTYGDPKILRWGAPTTLKVGSFCSIANDVTILLGGNHRSDWITTYPFTGVRESAKQINDPPVSRGDVIIGNDVWIGLGAVILSGVRIGNGAVIGASAVVTRDVPPYSIVAGNPAEVARTRFSEKDIDILESLEWWSWDDAKIDAAMPLLLSGDVPALNDFSLKYDQNAVKDSDES